MGLRKVKVIQPGMENMTGSDYTGGVHFEEGHAVVTDDEFARIRAIVALDDLGPVKVTDVTESDELISKKLSEQTEEISTLKEENKSLKEENTKLKKKIDDYTTASANVKKPTSTKESDQSSEGESKPTRKTRKMVNQQQ